MRHRPAKLCLTGLVAAALAAAAAPPPAAPFEAPAKATLQTRVVTVLHLGDYAVQFEHTPMLEVQRTLGGEVHHQGDALAWLCYTVPGKPAAAQLWISSGELQAGQIVDGVAALEEAAGAKAEADCPELPEKFRQLTLDNGIWLGANRAELQDLLPRPSAERGAWFEYRYAAKGQDAHQDEASHTATTVDYAESGSLLLDLAADRVVALFASQDTTYQ